MDDHFSSWRARTQFVFLWNYKIWSNWHTPHPFFAIGQASDAVLLKNGQNYVLLACKSKFHWNQTVAITELTGTLLLSHCLPPTDSPHRCGQKMGYSTLCVFCPVAPQGFSVGMQFCWLWACEFLRYGNLGTLPSKIKYYFPYTAPIPTSDGSESNLILLRDLHVVA